MEQNYNDNNKEQPLKTKANAKVVENSFSRLYMTIVIVWYEQKSNEKKPCLNLEA